MLPKSLLVACSVSLLASFSCQNVFALTAAARPNIIFILTDDQDAQMNSLDYMQGVQTHLIDHGTQYMNHFCTVALCCPSRVNLWTGKMAHNTNVTDVSPPYGGYPKFTSEGLNDDWLPVWMQDAGYATYYVGKLMNSHTVLNYNSPFPKGFTGSDFLLEPCMGEKQAAKDTYAYLNPIFQRNQDAPKLYSNQYSTDLVANKSLAFLDEGVLSGKPFFLTMAPVGPHVDIGSINVPSSYLKDAPIPAARYADAFPDAQVPRTPNFNPEQPKDVSWLKQLERQNETVVAYGDAYYRQRLRALQSVDEMLNRTMERLEHHGILNNTYIIYSSDNGYHIGQHRLLSGKNCPYEEDVHIPLVIRGPGIPKGGVNLATSHTNLAPTILQWASANMRTDLDGKPVPQSDSTSLNSSDWEHMQVEHWGAAAFEGLYKNDGPDGTDNSTYKALRIIGVNGTYSYYYSVWCNNDHELYDMQNDPSQMINLFGPGATVSISTSTSYGNVTSTSGFPIPQLQTRLDALLLVLKSCKTVTCQQPWMALHPDGSVRSLQDAMNAKYDDFYADQQPDVGFTECEPGYIISAEGPQDYTPYAGGA